MLRTALFFALMGLLAGCGNDRSADATNTADTAREHPARHASPVVASASGSAAAPQVDLHDVGDGTAANAGPASKGGNDASADTAGGPASAAECARRGGTWRRAGIMKLEVCDLPTRDAGKACRGKSDCESVCVAADGADPSGPVTGSCFRSTITVGTCLTLVEGGRIAQAQCAD